MRCSLFWHKKANVLLFQLIYVSRSNCFHFTTPPPPIQPPRLIEGYEIRIAMSVDATVHESQ